MAVVGNGETGPDGSAKDQTFRDEQEAAEIIDSLVSRTSELHRPEDILLINAEATRRLGENKISQAQFDLVMQTTQERITNIQDNRYLAYVSSIYRSPELRGGPLEQSIKDDLEKQFLTRLQHDMLLQLMISGPIHHDSPVPPSEPEST